MKSIKILAIAAAAGLVPASGRCEGNSALQTLKDGMSAQVEIVDAPPIEAAELPEVETGADNRPFIVEKFETSDAEKHLPASVRAPLQGAVAEITETAALARSVEASAAQAFLRRPGFEMAKEWSVTAGKIAGELEAERTKLLEAARSSGAALALEIEIARSLLAPAKRYLARAKTYLDALKEAGRPSPLPRDLAEENERAREEFRRLKRLY